MEANQFPGKLTRTKIKSNDRYLPTISTWDLSDFDNERFKKNRRFRNDKEWLEKDIKNQKKKRSNYSRIGRRLSRLIIKTFFDYLIRDILTTGEKFKLPTKQGDVFIGVDTKSSSEFNLITGTKKYYMRLFADYYFWMPYPEKDEYGYDVFLSKENRNLLSEHNIASDWSDTKEEL